jgi:hypothetical protein
MHLRLVAQYNDWQHSAQNRHTKVRSKADVNYPNSHLKNWEIAYFCDAYSRLQKIKIRLGYDVFLRHQGIETFTK